MCITSDSGTITQENTGEGKSIIVAILATIRCLQKWSTDIITSSSVLAERDAIEFDSFYKLFGFTVSSCKNEEEWDIPKVWKYNNIFENNVIYGDVCEF